MGALSGRSTTGEVIFGNAASSSPVGVYVGVPDTWAAGGSVPGVETVGVGLSVYAGSSVVIIGEVMFGNSVNISVGVYVGVADTWATGGSVPDVIVVVGLSVYTGSSVVTAGDVLFENAVTISVGMYVGVPETSATAGSVPGVEIADVGLSVGFL